jgi:hypothetical protein
MTARTWNKDRSTKRIQAKIDAVPLDSISIKPYVRDTDLRGLSKTQSYRVNGVHLYADILNLKDMLNVTAVEGETCHRRVLRFLNLHYRAVDRILTNEDAILVDFHNQRLHSVVAKPYGDEASRVHRAVAIGQMVIDVLARTGQDADHPAANVRIGIDTGLALAVSNGRRGHREPLFLGEPANHAAKRAGGGNTVGIYLTNNARVAIGLTKVASEDATPLTRAEIEVSQAIAKLSGTVDRVVADWEKDLEAHPIGRFEFSGHTPPYSSLDFELLAVGNSRRQDAMSVYGDLDGFTNYVSTNIVEDEDAKHVVRSLHILRSELDAVLHEDFKGRKVRFVGDCIHGLLVEGTAQNTDVETTVSNMVLCAGAMRSGFELALDLLKTAGTDATSLGLQVGFEFGPMTATRLGKKGELIRCSVSRGVLAAEAEQARCSGAQTAIGQIAYDKGTQAVRDVFGNQRIRKNLTYAVALEELVAKQDRTAKAAKSEGVASSLLKVASTTEAPYAFRNAPSGPAKRDGFA